MKDAWFFVPVGLYFVAVLGSLFFARKIRRTRWPFKEEDRLLRGPGESLRKELNNIDETMLFEFVAGIFVAWAIIPGTLLLTKFMGLGGVPSLVAASLGFAIGVGFCARRIVLLWRKRQAYHLGWFGERVVAEKLAPLRFSGWRVFHDVPFVSKGKPFNIDHVVVGEGGLFAIETKTRRMGGGRNGETDNEVCFDGQALHWPRHKNDESGLLQAERNAATLSKWVEEEIGQKVSAMPILVIPGWSLKISGQPGRRSCRVDSANWIQNTFKGRRPCIPKPTADLIVHRLLVKCRDVEN